MRDKPNHAYVEPWQGCALAWSEGPRMHDARVCGKPREAHPGQGWQPIETAPQMRKLIVFYRNSHGKGRCVMACYYGAHSLEMHDDYQDVGERDEDSGAIYAPAGWYEEHDTMMPLQCEPTHWMPLPEPPK